MVDAVAAESRRLAEVVRSADLAARVPSCPEWAVRDLAHHIGEVQWSWAENVRAADADHRSDAELVDFPDDGDLVPWLGWCTDRLTTALRERGPDSPCWVWWPSPRTAGAVGRHQVQEAAVHRWDAEGAAGPPGSGAPLATAVAEDGVGEFIETVIGPDARSLTGVVTLVASDTGGSWRIGGTDRGGRVRQASLTATASDIVLMLYRRLPVPDAIVDGDPLLVASLLSLADTT
jgi:uncharacterized protein (TIGR03083 family)